MSKFSYEYLKKAAENFDSLGTWKHRNVFAARTEDLDTLGGGAFLVLYEDGNKIVYKDKGRYWCWGVLKNDGTIDEYDKLQVWEKKEEKKEVKVEEEKKEIVVIDIEGVLKKARELTIAELLEDFKYI